MQHVAQGAGSVAKMNASLRLLHSVLPTSVSLHVAVPANHPSAQVLGTKRMGSGTLLDEDGLILTVNYVVLGAQTIEATLVDGTKVTAEVAAQDFFTGLAAVRIPGVKLPAARGNPSHELHRGQEVFILAAAGNSNRRVNSGAISALQPFDAFWEYHLERAIMTTAMNPGLGGGGLFTMSGALSGVVSLDLNEVGRFTMAIPIEYFLEYRDELLRHGRRVTRPLRAWVGLYCYALRDHVVLVGVLPGAPGERAGLRPGDVVLAVDGMDVSGRQDLYAQLWKRKPGDDIRFQVFRGNTVHEIGVHAADAEVFFA